MRCLLPCCLQFSWGRWGLEGGCCQCKSWFIKPGSSNTVSAQSLARDRKCWKSICFSARSLREFSVLLPGLLVAWVAAKHKVSAWWARILWLAGPGRLILPAHLPTATVASAEGSFSPCLWDPWPKRFVYTPEVWLSWPGSKGSFWREPSL